MDVMSAPEARYVRDDAPEQPPRVTRSAAGIKVERNKQFIVPSSHDFDRQYAHVYFTRYNSFKKLIETAATNKWPSKHVVPKLLDIEKEKECVVFGVLYKDMPLKPNILDEYHARENYEAPPPERSKYNSDEDALVLEDMSGRIVLIGDALDVGTHVSGVVVAVLGKALPSGEFQIADVCYPRFPPQKRLPKIPPSYVCLVSGLNISKNDKARLSMQLLSDFIQGNIGSTADQELAASIVHVIVAGNLVWRLDDEHQDLPLYKKRTMIPESVGHMREVDLFLAQMGINVRVDLMPGPHDPSDAILPQQPMHPCMFPLARNVSSVKGETNPYETTVAGRTFLGTSGQGVDDIYRFSTEEDRLRILEQTLEWAQLFPTAPDTLGCFPYHMTDFSDPFVITSCPHVYFAGNQPSFATKLVTGPEGQQVRLVCVPSFSDTHTAVLLNLATLECEPIQFDAP